MESLCVASCSAQAGAVAEIHRNVKGARNFSRHANFSAPARLACKSSSYLLGSTDIGILNAGPKQVKAILSRGPRCGATEGGNNSRVDIWVGRAAMLGFVAAIGTEITSGKGVLANIGVSTPAPTVALAITAAVGALVSFAVFRSASEE